MNDNCFLEQRIGYEYVIGTYLEENQNENGYYIQQKSTKNRFDWFGYINGHDHVRSVREQIYEQENKKFPYEDVMKRMVLKSGLI